MSKPTVQDAIDALTAVVVLNQVEVVKVVFVKA